MRPHMASAALHRTHALRASTLPTWPRLPQENRELAMRRHTAQQGLFEVPEEDAEAARKKIYGATRAEADRSQHVF